MRSVEVYYNIACTIQLATVADEKITLRAKPLNERDEFQLLGQGTPKEDRFKTLSPFFSLWVRNLLCKLVFRTKPDKICVCYSQFSNYDITIRKFKSSECIFLKAGSYIGKSVRAS